MKTTLSLTLSATLILWTLLLTACSKTQSEPFGTNSAPTSDNYVKWNFTRPADTAPQPETTVAFSETAATDTTAASTRAMTDEAGYGSFEEGDSIVLCARNTTDGSVRYYTLHLSGGEWLPRVYWSELGSEAEFTAWHLAPARELHLAGEASADYLHTLPSDQRNGSYEAADLLHATAHAQSGQRVSLTFGHALSRLRIVLQSPDASYTEEELQTAEVEVWAPGTISYRLTDGAPQALTDYGWITPATQSDNSRLTLLPPQTAAQMQFPDGWLRLRIAGRETTVAIPATVDGVPFEGLKAGLELTYRLNLRRADTPEPPDTPDPFAGTTQWVYGVQPPSDDQWNYDHTQLSWTEGCGWYDCNKTNPSDITAGGDGLMCWAAATSNLIHWWLYQNRTTAAVQAYTGPAATPSDMLHSAIFQLYKNHFPNQGDYPLKAINWFFNGIFHRTMYATDPVDPAAGFFREALGIRSLGAEYVGTEMQRDRFNALIKNALKSKQGILFVVNLGRAWTTHAVTLWGAKFDADGLIETLYMVDNNDGRSDARGTIRTMEVRYLPYSTTNGELYPYVPNSVGDFAVRIESVCTLSLGREWLN